MNTKDFNERRDTLLQEMLPNSVAVIPASQLMTRSRDTEFPFRQDSYFHYLAGFPEPDAWLVLSNHAQYERGLSVLFCLDKDPTQEIWHGRRFGPKQSKKQFSILVVVAIIVVIAVATGGDDKAVCENCVPPGAADIPADIEYVAPAN